LPFDPRTCPTSRSDRHKVGSTFNPTPITSKPCYRSKNGYLRRDTNQPSRYSKLEIILLCEKRHNPRKYRNTIHPSLCIFRDDPGTNLNFITQFQNAREDRSTSHTALEFGDFGTRFIDIEGADDDETGVGGEVAGWDGDALYYVFVDGINVVF